MLKVLNRYLIPYNPFVIHIRIIPHVQFSLTLANLTNVSNHQSQLNSHLLLLLCSRAIKSLSLYWITISSFAMLIGLIPLLDQSTRQSLNLLQIQNDSC